MRSKDTKALHGKTLTELEKDLEAKERELKKFHLDRRTKQLKNFRLGERLRDDIARVKTVLRQKQLTERVKT